MLDGEVEGRARERDLLRHARKPRRHLMPRDMIEKRSEIDGDQILRRRSEERFPVGSNSACWLGFTRVRRTNTSRDPRLLRPPMADERPTKSGVVAPAIEWQRTRGARSGRVPGLSFSDSWPGGTAVAAVAASGPSRARVTRANQRLGLSAPQARPVRRDACVGR